MGSPIAVSRWCLFGLHDHAGHVRVVAARVLICSSSRGTTRFNASFVALFAHAMNTRSEIIVSMPHLNTTPPEPEVYLGSTVSSNAQ